MNELVLGIDGGGSKTIALLADASGNIVGRGESGPSNYHAVGQETALAALDQAISAAVTSSGLPEAAVKAACMGMAGVDRPQDFALFAGWADRRFPGVPVKLVNDAQIVLAAGTPQYWGVAVISGTGSIVIGQDRSGNTARSGGWGYLMGDEGSGYQVGLAALQAAAKAADRRGPETSLTGRLLAYFEVESPAQLISAVYRPEINRPFIARLSRLVDEEAQKRDPVSLQIMDQAAVELALAIKAVAQKLHLQAKIPAALAGGFLVRGKSLQVALIRAVDQLGFTLEPVAAVQEPVHGAVKLALKSLE